MNYDGTLERCPFRGLLYINKNALREKLPYNNQKLGSRPKYFHKNKDRSKNTGPPQAKIPHPRPKANSVQFEDPYYHIHHIKNNNENTDLIDTQE